jgi:hypothetical protein
MDKNPKPKTQIRVIEFSGDERLKEAAIKALEYYTELLRDYFYSGTRYEYREPHYFVKIDGNEIVVRYLRVIKYIKYQDIDGTRRKVEKIYWRVRALVSS